MNPPAGLAVLEPSLVLSQAAALQRVAAALAYPEPGHRDLLLGVCTSVSQLQELHSAWAATSDEQARAEYSRLFIGLSGCSLNETAWTGSRRPGGGAIDLSDLQAFYQAFGVDLHDRSRGREAPDHLSTELEFLAILCIKQAWATVQGWEAERVVTEDAIRRFLEDHLGCWAALCSQTIRTKDAGTPYRETTLALDRLMDWAIAAFGASVSPAEASIGSREPDVVGCPYAEACNSAQPPDAC